MKDLIITEDITIERSTSRVDSRTTVFFNRNYSQYTKFPKDFSDDQIRFCLSKINHYYSLGFSNGGKEAQKEIREALGIFTSDYSISIGDIEIEK